MHTFDLAAEEAFDLGKHVERILAVESGGDFTVACWEPGQISPYHCHPEATEMYFCVSGGGVMRTPTETVTIKPGAFVVHPPGEVHEYENGAERSVLFRVRYGKDMVSHHINWRGREGWTQRPRDAAYFAAHPVEIPQT